MVKVSVIVPVYGVENYILKCMDSLVNQTLKDIEIVVVNDGTKDKSIDLIKENYTDKRIKIYNKENGGVARARNFGVTKATGEYLFFVDSDDFLKEDAIEVLYKKAFDKKCDLVICDYYKYYDDKNYTSVHLVKHYDCNHPASIITAMPGPVCKLMKRDFYLKNKIAFMEDNAFEDNAIMPLIGALAKKHDYIQEPLYYYLQRDGSSLNKKYYDKRWEDIFASLNHLSNKFLEYGVFKKYYQELEYIYIEYLLHAANLRFIEYKEGIVNIKRVSKVMKEKFPNWRKNKYYQKENMKYKVICNLFYYKLVGIINFIRRKK